LANVGAYAGAVRKLRRLIGLAALALVAVPCAQSAGADAGRPRAGRHVPRSITLEWVGDIALSTERGLPPGGLERSLAPVRTLLRDADVTLGNLEGTLSVGGVSKCRQIGGGECFAFQAPPSTAFALRGLGFDLVNQANNHSLDYGVSGRRQTVAALDRAGIAHTGFPGEITYLRVRGCAWPSLDSRRTRTTPTCSTSRRLGRWSGEPGDTLRWSS
jgi:Bacterial capsule synthesis protein PGA_cap